MKLIKFSLGFSLIAILFVVSCSKNDVTNIESTQLKASNFDKIGEIHNSFLTNVKDHFTPIESKTAEQEKIEAIYQFNKNFVSSLDISTEEKTLLIVGLEESKYLVKENVLISKSFGVSLSNKLFESEENLVEMIDNMKANGIINNDSYQILNSLSNDLKANYEGSLPDNQLKTNVQSLINDYNDIGYPSNSEGGMVGTILAISISSIEWWEQNPDALDNLASRSNASNKALIAPWLATSAGVQYGVTGEVNWEVVGWTALATGAAASTGIIGKNRKMVVLIMKKEIPIKELIFLFTILLLTWGAGLLNIITLLDSLIITLSWIFAGIVMELWVNKWIDKWVQAHNEKKKRSKEKKAPNNGT